MIYQGARIQLQDFKDANYVKPRAIFGAPGLKTSNIVDET